MIIHLTVTTNRNVEISKSDLEDLMRVHRAAERKDGQEIEEWLFEAMTDNVIDVLVGLSEVEDEDFEVTEVEDEDE